ncbi:hypothetical protein ES705_21278 [subsurface metagenome]
MRTVLLEEYEKELRNADLNFSYIEGEGEDRMNNTIREVKQFLQKHS